MDRKIYSSYISDWNRGNWREVTNFLSSGYRRNKNFEDWSCGRQRDWMIGEETLKNFSVNDKEETCFNDEGL
jgi:hypothetical protein